MHPVAHEESGGSQSLSLGWGGGRGGGCTKSKGGSGSPCLLPRCTQVQQPFLRLHQGSAANRESEQGRDHSIFDVFCTVIGMCKPAKPWKGVIRGEGGAGKVAISRVR